MGKVKWALQVFSPFCLKPGYTADLLDLDSPGWLGHLCEYFERSGMSHGRNESIPTILHLLIALIGPNRILLLNTLDYVLALIDLRRLRDSGTGEHCFSIYEKYIIFVAKMSREKCKFETLVRKHFCYLGVLFICETKTMAGSRSAWRLAHYS